MTKFADLEKLRKPATLTVTLQLDGEVQEQIDRLRRRISATKQAVATGQTPDVPEMPGSASLADPAPITELEALEAELQALLASAEETQFTFVFRAQPYAVVERIKNAHPPTDEQAAENMVFNPDGVGPALLAACLEEPEIDVEEAQRLWNEWPNGMVNTLYRAAWDVCHSAPVVRPLSNGASAKTPATAKS